MCILMKNLKLLLNEVRHIYIGQHFSDKEGNL